MEKSKEWLHIECSALSNVGDWPKTQNPNLKVEDKDNDMELCESKVDLMSDYDVDLKKEWETDDQVKIVFGQSGGIL